MKHVINTDAYMGVIANLNTASQIALAKEVAARSKAKRESLEQTTLNKLKEVEDLAKEAERKADFFGDDEKKQLESVLKELVKTEGMQTILDTVCLDLGGGENHSLKSVIIALAKADQIKMVEPQINTDSGDLEGEKYTLADDTIVLMSAVKTSLENGDIRFDVTATGTEKWKGIDAGYHFIIRPIKVTETIEGEQYEMVKRHDLVEKTNIVFDLTNQLVPCGGMNTDVDLNGDGVIGTPEDTEAGESGNAGDGAVIG